MTDVNERWQCIDTGAQPGSVNMQVDRDTVLKVQQGIVPQTLRVYAWEPWAISLGYHQQESDIDTRRAAADGIDVVRRPTGGRAILHAREVTYSVVMFSQGRGTQEIYRVISEAIVTGLKKICSSVEFELSQPNFSQLYRKAESIPCFSASAKYEIQIHKKKLVGSAQHRYTSHHFPDVILQHGSILLGDEHKQITKYIRNTDENVAGKMKSDLSTKTISLEEAMQRTVSYDEVVDVVKSGFEEAWNISFSHHVAEPA